MVVSSFLIFFATVAKPLTIIGHRGHPALLPEHSEPGYISAIKHGADFIECDVHFTRDLVAVCSHDPWLDELTDVGQRPNLAHLRRTLTAKEAAALGSSQPDQLEAKWWLWDLTWKQAKELRLQGGRDSTFDRQFALVTLERFITIAEESGRKVGIYPELKSAEAGNLVLASRNQETTVEQLLVQILHGRGYDGLAKEKKCLVQSFEMASLVRLHHLTNIPLVFLVENDRQLENISCYSTILHGVGLWKQQVVEVDLKTRKLKNRILDQVGGNNIVERMQTLGLQVHVYTLRNHDNKYMALEFEQDPYLELAALEKLGVDGVFTDNTPTAVRYRNTTRCRTGAA